MSVTEVYRYRKQCQRRFNTIAGCSVCGAMDSLHRHHIDRDISNNAVDNVLIVCVSCHSLIHKHM